MLNMCSIKLQNQLREYPLLDIIILVFPGMPSSPLGTTPFPISIRHKPNLFQETFATTIYIRITSKFVK